MNPLSDSPAAEQNRRRVGAVIVTYFPEPDALDELIAATRAQVNVVIVVDNTPAPPSRDPEGRSVEHGGDVEFIRNERNVGLAAAQNQGIGRLRDRGCDFVLLLDQDSLPDATMVARLLDSHDRLVAAGARVGAVGPLWIDRQTGGAAAFVRIGLGRLTRVRCTPSVTTVPCDALVASGCLLPMAALHDVGDMDAALFIDQIDNDWGLRAQARGWKLYGACDARLRHGIGESRLRIWLLRWRNVSVHKPLRDYYKVRNTLVVFFLRPAPWRWRLHYAQMLLALTVLAAVALPQRGQRLKMMLRGARDAVFGRMGPYHEPAVGTADAPATSAASRVWAQGPARQLLRRVWRRMTRRRARMWEQVRREIEGRAGMEIGGPSPIFDADGTLPIYPSVNSIDNCNFSRETLWEAGLNEGAPYLYDKRRAPGRQLIAEATDLSGIASGSRTFVLSSHALEHCANPLKALREWYRVLWPGGSLVLVLPHKDATFDHRRPVTPLSHLIADANVNMGEDDTTHLEEIFALHDIERDEWAGGFEAFCARSMDNLNNRGLHHHVFDSHLAAQIVDHTGFQIVAIEAQLQMDIVVLARRPLAGETVNNAAFLDRRAAFLADSPFPTDRAHGALGQLSEQTATAG